MIIKQIRHGPLVSMKQSRAKWSHNWQLKHTMWFTVSVFTNIFFLMVVFNENTKLSFFLLTVRASLGILFWRRSVKSSARASATWLFLRRKVLGTSHLESPGKMAWPEPSVPKSDLLPDSVIQRATTRTTTTQTRTSAPEVELWLTAWTISGDIRPSTSIPKNPNDLTDPTNRTNPISRISLTTAAAAVEVEN